MAGACCAADGGVGTGAGSGETGAGLMGSGCCLNGWIGSFPFIGGVGSGVGSGLTSGLGVRSGLSLGGSAISLFHSS